MKWFRQCFDSFAQSLPSKEISIAMPFAIGCGMAGGQWERDYYPLLIELAEQHRLPITLYKYTTTTESCS